MVAIEITIWYHQRNSMGHIASKTSVTNLTAFIVTKYCKNYESKYNDDHMWIIDSSESDHMTSNKSNLSS